MRTIQRLVGWLAIAVGVALAVSSLVLGGQSPGPDSALEEWASMLGMGPDLLAWVMGAAGILCIAGGVSLLGQSER